MMSKPELTGTYAQYDLLLRLQRPGTIAFHRFVANGRTVHVQTGDHCGTYEGRVVQAPRLHQSFGDEPAPRIVLPEFTCEIARTDENRETVDALIAEIDGSYRSERMLLAYLSAAGDCAADDLVFQGIVGEDGVQITSERILLRARCSLADYDIELPGSHYLFERDCGDADRIGSSVPILYGDWTDAPSYYWLPLTITERRTEIADGSQLLGAALCKPNRYGIDSLIGPCRWRFASGEDHGFQIWAGRYSLQNPQTDADPVSLELARSRAVDAGSQRNVWQKGDTVHVKAARGNRDEANELLEDPVAIIYDLLTEYAGANDRLYIGDSINPGEGRVKTAYRVRAYLDRPRKLITQIVGDLCRDTGLIFYVTGNKFEVAKHPLFHWQSADEPPIASADSLRCLDGQRHCGRPSAWNYRGVKLYYRKNPSTGNYTAKMHKGAEPFYTVESEWLWRDCDARAWVGSMYSALTEDGSPRAWLLELPLHHVGLNVGPGDKLSWTGDGQIDQTYYVCDIERDFGASLARIKALRRALPEARATWVPDSQASLTYAAASEAQKRDYGWYTDVNGEIDGDAHMSDVFNETS